MKLLHRYIFTSLFFTSLAVVGLFVFVLLTGNALKNIVGLLAAGQLTWSMFFDLLLLLIPYVVSYALPLGILTGVLMVLGRLAAQREIVAFKSAGLSLWYIAAPVFAVAIIGVVLSSLINNYYAPNAKIQYRNTLSNIVRHDPLRFIEARTFIHEFPGYVLYLGSKEGNALEDFWIWELDDHHQAVKLLRARTGHFDYDASTDALILTLKDGFSELRSEKNPDNLQSIRPTVVFKEARFRLPLDRILGSRRKYTSFSAMNLHQLLRKRTELVQALERLTPSAEAEEEQRDLVKDKIKVQIQMQKNFAMAFSIFSLTLIGIPLGIKVSRKETYANTALALTLALVYYFLIIAVGWLEKQPALRPDLLIWGPNLLFQGVGLWFLARASRY